MRAVNAVLLLGAVALGAGHASGAVALRALDGDDGGDDDNGTRPPVRAPTAPPPGAGAGGGGAQTPPKVEGEDGGGKGTAIGLAVGAAALLALGAYKYSRKDGAGAVHGIAPPQAKQGGLAVSVHAGPAAGAPYAQPMSAQSSSSQPRATNNTRGEAGVAPRQLPQQSQHQSRDSANTWSKGAEGWGGVQQQQQQRPLAQNQPQSRESFNTWNKGAIAEPRVQPAQTQQVQRGSLSSFDSRAHDFDDLTLYGKPISI
jgi:hypothetical protein